VKGTQVTLETDASWRTVQVFLSNRFKLYETELNLKTNEIRCNCPGFTSRKQCKHSRHVLENLQANSGTFTLDLRASAPEADPETMTAEQFRSYVVHNGNPFVIPDDVADDADAEQ
jgi:hypothetical protein